MSRTEFEYGKSVCRTCKYFKLEGECYRCTHPSNIEQGLLNTMCIYKQHPNAKNIFGKCDYYKKCQNQ